MRTRQRGPRRATVAVVTALLLAGCSGNGSGGESNGPSVSTSTPADELRMVVLGDSTAGSDTCPGCTIYSEQLATAMEDRLGVDVKIDNLAWAVTNPRPAEVAAVLHFVRADSAARDSVAAAEAIVITIGHNNLAYNRLDDPCDVAPAYPRVKWKSLTHKCIDKANAEYGRGLDALLTEIDHLRRGRPTMVRVTTVYNSVIGDLVDPTWNSSDAIEPSTYAVEKMVHTQCQVAARHGALCADTYHVLNGHDGSQSAQPFLNKADATHLAQAGDDAFAAALIKLGFAPIASASASYATPSKRDTK